MSAVLEIKRERRQSGQDMTARKLLLSALDLADRPAPTRRRNGGDGYAFPTYERRLLGFMAA